MWPPGWGRPLGRSLLRPAPRLPYASRSICAKVRLKKNLLTMHNGCRFLSSEVKSIFPSEVEILQQYLKETRNTKWGWVIYRCTYNDDETWNKLKESLIQSTRQQIAESEIPELGDSLEWTFIEDRALLEGASKAQLRDYFKAWREVALKVERPENPDGHHFYDSRFNYFVQVDEESLQSIKEEFADYNTLRGTGHVNFLLADWQPESEFRYPDEEPSEKIEEPETEDEYEPIEGCQEENVGWTMVSFDTIGLDFFVAMLGNPDVWYVFYRRPPDVLYW